MDIELDFDEQRCIRTTAAFLNMLANTDPALPQRVADYGYAWSDVSEFIEFGQRLITRYIREQRRRAEAPRTVQDAVVKWYFDTMPAIQKDYLERAGGLERYLGITLPKCFGCVSPRVVSVGYDFEERGSDNICEDSRHPGEEPGTGDCLAFIKVDDPDEDPQYTPYLCQEHLADWLVTAERLGYPVEPGWREAATRRMEADGGI